jgi:hypothetical protein
MAVHVQPSHGKAQNWHPRDVHAHAAHSTTAHHATCASVYQIRVHLGWLGTMVLQPLQQPPCGDSKGIANQGTTCSASTCTDYRLRAHQQLAEWTCSKQQHFPAFLHTSSWQSRQCSKPQHLPTDRNTMRLARSSAVAPKLMSCLPFSSRATRPRNTCKPGNATANAPHDARVSQG